MRVHFLSYESLKNAWETHLGKYGESLNVPHHKMGYEGTIYDGFGFCFGANFKRHIKSVV